MLAAMHRASSRVRRCAAERRSSSPSKSRTMKHRRSSLGSASSTDQGGGKRRAARQGSRISEHSSGYGRCSAGPSTDVVEKRRRQLVGGDDVEQVADQARDRGLPLRGLGGRRDVTTPWSISTVVVWRWSASGPVCAGHAARDSTSRTIVKRRATSGALTVGSGVGPSTRCRPFAPGNSGSLAMLAAMRRASSWVTA